MRPLLWTLLAMAAAVARRPGAAVATRPTGPLPPGAAGAAAAAAGSGRDTARLRARLAEAPPSPSAPPQERDAPDDDGGDGGDDDEDEEGGPAIALHLNKKLLPVAAAEVTALGAALFPPLQLQSRLLEPIFEPPLLDRRDRDGEEEDEEEEVRASITMALARTLGQLGKIDVAKEVYLSLLARQHPFPFCAWQVIFDPQVFTPVLLDTNSVYRMQALHFRTRSDVFRITGRFPRVRYFSFQVRGRFI